MMLLQRRHLLLSAAASAVAGMSTRSLSAVPCAPPEISVDGRRNFAETCVASPGQLPAWLRDTSAFQWVRLPGSQIADAQQGFESPGGSKAGVTAYSGGAVKAAGSELFVMGGGHADYAGNEVYSIRLSEDMPKWRRRNDPTAIVNPVGDVGVSHYSDGRPSARHTYWSCQFINARNRLITFGSAAVWGNGNGGFSAVDAFDPEANDYEPAGTYPSQPGINGVAVGVAVDAAENVYVHHAGTGNLFRWNQTSNTWSTLGNRGPYDYETAYARDTRRNRIVRVMGRTSSSAGYFDLGRNAEYTNIRFVGSSSSAMNNGSLVYDPVVDCFWFWKRGGALLYRVDPESWAVSSQPVVGAVPDNTYQDGNHNIYGRFNYVPELRGLVFVKDTRSDVYFVRTA